MTMEMSVCFKCHSFLFLSSVRVPPFDLRDLSCFARRMMASQRGHGRLTLVVVMCFQSFSS